MFKFPNPVTFHIDLGDLEAEFRAHYLPLSIQQTRAAIAFAVIAVASLSTIDYLLYGDSSQFFINLFARGIFVLISAFVAYLLARHLKFATYEKITLGWSLILTGLTFYVDYNRPPDFTQNITFHILMALSGYVLIPLRPVLRVIAPVLMTLGNFWIIFTVKEIPSAVWMGVTVSTYLLLHIAGILTAVRTYNALRVQFRAENELRLSNERLRQLAITDDLTGIYNRRYFLERAQEEFERFQRHRHSFSLMIADLDLLKQVNDSHGHQAGDLAIRLFTNLVAREKRATDIFGRLGGEEFGLLLPDTSISEAQVVVNRIYDGRKILVVRTADENVNFTFTAGVAECRPEHHTLDDLFRAADRALYRGKSGGRNRVEVDE
ncbi:MAG: GGDEF domain-containing protein [Chloroflexota bacterium]